MSKLLIYNSLSALKEEFVPLSEENVKIYVCGPTVYSAPHIGNMRSAVVYDVLLRILKKKYPKVTYIRNITDVDDKIINQSKLLNVSPDKITQIVTKQFQDDVNLLGCLEPTEQPKATQNIQEMINMIDILIKKDFAYISDHHVLFSVKKYKDYGALSKKNIEQLICGARIEVENYKKDANDFVLWKPVDKKEYGFESKFGYGRPGWHIECSAMASKYLGEEFDIHGGGADLKFPHHENEVAQSVCASGKKFAKYWMHNGFVTLNGEKMSKSSGNFYTLQDLIQKNHHPEVIRLSLLSTHYRKPLNFTDALLYSSQNILIKFYTLLKDLQRLQRNDLENFEEESKIKRTAWEVILNDINLTKYFALMQHQTRDIINTNNPLSKIKLLLELKAMGNFIGILTEKPEKFLSFYVPDQNIPENIIKMGKDRFVARQEKDFATSDNIRDKIFQEGYEIIDLPSNQFKIIKISD